VDDAARAVHEAGLGETLKRLALHHSGEQNIAASTPTLSPNVNKNHLPVKQKQCCETRSVKKDEVVRIQAVTCAYTRREQRETSHNAKPREISSNALSACHLAPRMFRLTSFRFTRRSPLFPFSSRQQAGSHFLPARRPGNPIAPR
jgi:hypothetical protein